MQSQIWILHPLGIFSIALLATKSRQRIPHIHPPRQGQRRHLGRRRRVLEKDPGPSRSPISPLDNHPRVGVITKEISDIAERRHVVLEDQGEELGVDLEGPEDVGVGVIGVEGHVEGHGGVGVEAEDGGAVWS